MMKISSLMLLALLVAFMGPVNCQDDDDMVVDDDDEVYQDEEEVAEPVEVEVDYEEEEWDGTLTENADIHCVVSFPDYPDKRLPIDKELTMLIGVTNNGNEVYNISVVGASLHSPYDFNYYIQNFSYKQFQDVLPPTAQYTLEYRFTPDAKLQALDYWFSAFIIVNGTRRIYKQIPINGTLTLTAEGNSFLFDVIQMLATLVVVGGVGFGIFTILTGGKYNKTKKTKGQAPAPKAEATENDGEDDWDIGVPTQIKAKAINRKGKKQTKKAD